MTRRTTPWLLREPSPRAETRVFCLPFAGIGASAYRTWPARHGVVEVCPVQLPGRENRSAEAVPAELGDIAREIITALLPYFDRPFALFGHCMGGLIAHEIVRELKRQDAPVPVRLYASAARAPHSDHRGPLHACMSDAELARALVSSAGAEIDDALLSVVLPLAIRLLRNDLERCGRYQPAALPLACPITTFGWSEDRGLPLEELRGWRAYGVVAEYLVEGDHFAVQTAASTLLGIIDRDFRELLTPTMPTASASASAS